MSRVTCGEVIDPDDLFTTCAGCAAAEDEQHHATRGHSRALDVQPPGPRLPRIPGAHGCHANNLAGSWRPWKEKTMPDATYVGAGMPCGNCGNPLTLGQPHKCGRTPDQPRDDGTHGTRWLAGKLPPDKENQHVHRAGDR